MAKSKWFGCCILLWIAPMMMGAYGSCAPGCPEGSYLGPDSTCWVELNRKYWQPVNRGELQVKLHTPPRNPKQATQHALRPYRFVFVQDPAEVYSGKGQGRFGQWRIRVETDHSTHIKQALLLRWRLRDRPGTIKRSQSVRLVASWFKDGQRRYMILDGQYFPRSRRLQAVLPPTIQEQQALWLFPARVNKTQALAKTAMLFHTK